MQQFKQKRIKWLAKRKMELDKKERLKEDREKLLIKIIVEDLMRETEEDERTITKIVKDKILTDEANKLLFWIFFWVITGTLAIFLLTYFYGR